MDSYPNRFPTSIDSLDIIPSDLLGHVPPNFRSVHLVDYVNSEIASGSMSILGSPTFESYLTPGMQTEASQAQSDDSGPLNSVSIPPEGGQPHDCFLEAHNILGSLSSYSLNNGHPVPQSLSGTVSTAVDTGQHIPLDRVLSINREAGERLSGLLACSCATSPYLALLCASIISRILILYQQAAAFTQGPPSNPAALTLETTSSHMPSASSGSGFRTGSSSAWSSTPTSATTSTHFNGLAVAPAKIAIGTFNVDDLAVQTALKIQMLSGEVRRAGHLIDRFALRESSDHSLGNEVAFGGTTDLFQSLKSWLRGEHSRITHMMRFKLRELNI